MVHVDAVVTDGLSQVLVHELLDQGHHPRGAESYQSEGVPLFRSQNIHFDGLRMDDIVYVDAETHESMSNSKVFEGDVLINITGASIGRCFYIESLQGEANVAFRPVVSPRRADERHRAA